MNLSYPIKQALLRSILDQESSAVDDHQPAGKKGRVNGAIALSIFTYGGAIESSAAMPIPPSLASGETLIPSTKIIAEGSYPRSKSHHPSRELYDSVINGLIKLIQEQIPAKKFQTAEVRGIAEGKAEVVQGYLFFGNGVKVRVKNSGKLAKISKLLEAIKLLADNQHKKKGPKLVSDPTTDASWLGQWLTPEELLEDIFAKLSESDGDQLIQSIAAEELEKLTFLYGGAIPPLPAATPSREPKAELVDLPIRVTFGSIIEKKKHIVSEISLAANRAVEGTRVEVQPHFPLSQYPNVMFNLRQLFNRLRIPFREGRKSGNELVNLNRLLMSYFCGLLNFESIKRYGKKRVWSKPQASFGGDRPSFADTELWFRFSPGMVPDDFHEVVASAYTRFCAEIETPEVLAQLKQFHDTVSATSDVAYGYGRETAQHRALNFSVRDQGLAKFVRCYNDGSFRQYQSEQDEAVLVERRELYQNAQVYQSYCVKDPRPALAPLELRAVYQELLLAAKRKPPVGQRHGLLAGVEQVLRQQLQQVCELYDSRAECGVDYNATLSAVETLRRMLQINAEFEILHEQDRPMQDMDGAAADVMGGDGHDAAALDAVGLSRSSSRDSTLTRLRNCRTYSTRSGMGALFSVMAALNRTLQGGAKPLITMDESYFELHPVALERMIRLYYFKYSGVAKASCFTIEDVAQNPDAPAGDIQLVDLAAFPTRVDSRENKWKRDWAVIPQEQRPSILVVDITCCTEADLEHLYGKFSALDWHEKPYMVLTHSSNVKFAQAGLNLVPMGEARMMTRDNVTDSVALKLVESVEQTFSEADENSIAATAARRVLRDFGANRTLQPYIYKQDLLQKMEALLHEHKQCGDQISLFISEAMRHSVHEVVVSITEFCSKVRLERLDLEGISHSLELVYTSIQDAIGREGASGVELQALQSLVDELKLGFEQLGMTARTVADLLAEEDDFDLSELAALEVAPSLLSQAGSSLVPGIFGPSYRSLQRAAGALCRGEVAAVEVVEEVVAPKSGVAAS